MLPTPKRAKSWHSRIERARKTLANVHREMLFEGPMDAGLTPRRMTALTSVISACNVASNAQDAAWLLLREAEASV